MKRTLILLIAGIIFVSCQNRQPINENVITTDITNFWEAYDNITTTQDSVLQYNYLDSLYFKKGTAGLEGIREVRNYTAQDYICLLYTSDAADE